MNCLPGIVGVVCIGCVLGGMASPSSGQVVPARFISDKMAEHTVQALLQKHGKALRDRIRAGVDRVAIPWWAEDSSEQAFSEFSEERFIVLEKESV